MVRVWIEAEHATPLRARITQTGDGGRREHMVATGAGVEDILRAIQSWLEDFTAP